MEILTSSPWNKFMVSHYDDIKFCFIPPNCDWSKPYAVGLMLDRLRFMWNLSKYLSRESFDILQTADNVVRFYLTRKRRRLIILQPFEEIYELKAEFAKEISFAWYFKLWLLRKIKSRWDEYCMRNSDFVGSEGEFQSEIFARKFHVEPERIIEIPVVTELPHVVSSEEKERLRSELHFKARDTVVISVNRLDYNKGIRLLTDAMNIVMTRKPNVKLLIVGKGPLSNWLNERIQVPPFAGRSIHFEEVAESKLSSLYWLSDLYVSTSYDTGSLQSVLEAMAHFLPVISTGQAFWIKDGYNGFIASSRNDGSLADLVSNALNSDIRVLGANARRTAERYTYAKLARLLLEKYEAIGKVRRPAN